MSITEIRALSGDGFDTFLQLINAEGKPSELDVVWQEIEQRVDIFSKGEEILDLNAIFVEMMTLKLLVAPTLENTRHPLKGEDWQKMPAQIKNDWTQLKRIQKYLTQIQSEDAELEKLLLPLFDRLKTVYREMGVYWNSYQQDWKEFQKLDSDEEEAEKKIKEPPVFNHAGWAAAQLSFKTLIAELGLQKKKKGSFLDQNNISNYPVFQLLVKEVQDLARGMEGFELLEKIQLAQKRNEQLAQKLQPFYGAGPIIVKQITPPPPNINSSPAAPKKNNLKYKKEPPKKNKKLLWLLVGLIVLCLGVLSQLSQPPPVSNGIQAESTSDFKRPGVFSKQFAPPRVNTAAGSVKNTEGQLLQMLKMSKIDMAVYSVDDNLKQMLDAETVPKELLKKMVKDLQQPLILVADEGTAYLVSAEDSVRYDSLEELKNLLDTIAEHYQQMLETVKVLQNELLQYEVSFMIENKGQPGYSLLLRDTKNQVVGQIDFGTKGLNLQWKGMDNVLSFETAEELADAVKKIEKF
ncbi:MAG: hypothetical protein HQM14_03620 [SAR324 cluster bacterium]|nr:hypothetical protein [SAR324 cluster bacterium]